MNKIERNKVRTPLDYLKQKVI